jgi:hypothetical protein
MAGLSMQTIRLSLILPVAFPFIFPSLLLLRLCDIFPDCRRVNRQGEKPWPESGF